ncbi:alpha/beta fold hydrolase [Roseibium sp.]|uniref:alpha/beta fold hydrolase n=1 Tax=Roseibium sp. TaxID=1936156 RepID=UPI003A9809C3
MNRRHFIVGTGLLASAAGMAMSGNSGTASAVGIREGRLLQIDGRTVHAVQEGSGPDVILIHGASGNLRDMTFSLAPRLARTFRVTAFDRPGLGFSEPLHREAETPIEQAQHLAKAASQLGISKAVIVGHSYGGAVALAWGLERPDQAAALVSLAGAAMPWPGDLGAWYGFASSTIGGGLLVPVLSRLTPDSFVDNAVKDVFAPDAVPDGYAAFLGRDLALNSKILVKNARQVGSLKPQLAEMQARYPALDMPLEIVHGIEDDTVPLDVHSIPLSKAAPHARLLKLPGHGHMIHHAAEDDVAAAITSAAGRAGLRG